MSSKSATNSLFPSADEASLVSTPDGSFHIAPRRLTVETKHSTDRYPLPQGVGNIVRVRLFADDSKPFEILECPATANYIRVFANGQSPHTDGEARQLLKAVRAKFGKALWLRYENHLYLHPHPVNSGELLIVDYEPVEYAQPDER